MNRPARRSICPLENDGDMFSLGWNACLDQVGDVMLTQRQFDELGQIIDLKHRFAHRMAKLLRELEWSGSAQVGIGDGCDSCCPCCYGWAPGQRYTEEGHTSDCELAAILAEWDSTSAKDTK